MQNIAGRVVAQLLLSLVFIPIAASIILSVLCFISPPHNIWSYVIPKGLPNTILAAIITMLSLPYLLDRVDDYYARVAAQKSSEDKKSS